MPLFTLVLLLLAVENRAEAALPWYQFEIIVFERIAPGAGTTEAWPDDPGTPSLLDAVPLRIRAPKQQDDSGEPVPFATLPKSAWQLAEHEQRLKRSRNYRPLLHLAWRQQVTDPRRAQRLYLKLPQKNQSRAAPEAPPKVEGTISLGVERYLHLQVDLLLRRLEMADTQNSRQGRLTGLGPYYQPYRLQSQRRMRSGELHYLDHPILGVLFLATKYTLPQPEPAPDPVAEPAATPPTPAVTPGAAASEPPAGEPNDSPQ